MKLGYNWMILLISVSLWGQTEIVKTDVENLAGAVGRYEISNTGSVALDLGAEGAGNVWDFTQLNMGTTPNQDEYTLQNIIGTPDAADFPRADYVMKESHVDDTTWYVHTYVKLKEDSLKIIARKMKDENGIGIRWGCPEDYYALPLALGTSWVSVQKDTFDFGDGNPFISVITSTNIVDAAGVVKLPIGDFDCVRLRTVSAEESGGGVFRYINYKFLAKNNLLVALVQGQPDDTTHQFANAVYVQRFTGIETRVKKGQESGPARFTLAQNYPNPFNPKTRIRFELPDYSRVDLAVFNLQGERVKTLHSGYLVPGAHSFLWDGTNHQKEDVASGVYVYRLRSRGHVESRRMVLLR